MGDCEVRGLGRSRGVCSGDKEGDFGGRGGGSEVQDVVEVEDWALKVMDEALEVEEEALETEQ